MLPHGTGITYLQLIRTPAINPPPQKYSGITSVKAVAEKLIERESNPKQKRIWKKVIKVILLIPVNTNETENTSNHFSNADLIEGARNTERSLPH